MKAKLLLLMSVVMALSACGDGESNLTGSWFSEQSTFFDVSGKKKFVKISKVDSDGNVFACLNLTEKELANDCNVQMGKPVKVITPNKACLSNGVGQSCFEYHTESQTLTIDGYNKPFTKVQ